MIGFCPEYSNRQKYLLILVTETNFSLPNLSVKLFYPRRYVMIFITCPGEKTNIIMNYYKKTSFLLNLGTCIVQNAGATILDPSE